MESKKQPKILILDDDPMVGDVARDMLGFLGYQGVHASIGEEAISLYRQYHEAGTPFSAVITDLRIPDGMGGREALDEILAINREAVVFVSSGQPFDPVMVNYNDYGFAGALAKPFDLSTFQQLLLNV